MPETELDRAQKRYEQAKARLQALRNREAAKERKIDTRRKVILGGALMDLATRDNNAAVLLDRLVRNLPREQDRKTFDGWNLEARTALGSEDNRAAPPAPSGPDGTA
ncbi:mobilization protein [Paracoccus niistensis]|uniref:Mobilization protein n=1 Tax=Paracoccus niistensis TaxID=632935 RepID=A0ABV6I8K1_9RHOB